MTYATAKINEMLSRFEAALKTRQCPNLQKELVFNRVRVLKAEGFTEDVAFAKALIENGFAA